MSGGPRRRAVSGLGGFVPPTLEDAAPPRADPEAPSAEPAVRTTPAASAAAPAAERERRPPDPGGNARSSLAPAGSAAAHEEPAHTPRRRRPYKRRRVGMEAKYEGEIVRTTITLPTAVDDKLDEIVFHQRKSGLNKNDLMLQGIEAVLMKYGAGKIDSLVKASRSK